MCCFGALVVFGGVSVVVSSLLRVASVGVRCVLCVARWLLFGVCLLFFVACFVLFVVGVCCVPL